MPETKILAVDFSIKAVMPAERIIEGYAAFTGNTDRVGDVIEAGANAKAAQTPPGDVGVFIGHQAMDLPVGRCLELRSDPSGLWTKTYVFPTARGDELLQTAAALQAAGSSLGMSIGYHLDDYSFERRGSKMVRVIRSYKLNEYSFAARQVIANPMALVTGVKARTQKVGAPGTFAAANMALMECFRETYRDAWAQIEDIYPDRVVYCLSGSGGVGREYYQASYSIGPDGKATLGEPVEVMPNWTAKTTPESSPEQKAVWSTAYVNDLPDSAFLDIQSGGEKDDEGKTVPRSYRHFPFKDAEGKVDAAHLRNAIARIPQASYEGLDDAKKARLQARARRMLDNLGDGKALDADADEWKTGAAVAVRAIGYGLLDLSEAIATELKAMSLLGSDTKGNGRLRPEQRQKLADLAGELGRVVRHAELIDAEQDGAAQIALNRSRLQLLEV